VKIRLTKESESKPGITAFIRDDGTATWQKSSDFFARHDLIHYVVETSLEYREAFLGLLARGRDLSSFGTQNGVKDVYTQEEVWAESIVGICQWPDRPGDSPPDNQELLALLAKTFKDRNEPGPVITESQLAEIRKRVQDLHHRWDLLPGGETLELEVEC
jgi:hypothetical protein